MVSNWLQTVNYRLLLSKRSLKVFLDVYWIVNGRFVAGKFVAGKFVAENSSQENSSHGKLVAGKLVAWKFFCIDLKLNEL